MMTSTVKNKFIRIIVSMLLIPILCAACISCGEEVSALELETSDKHINVYAGDTEFSLLVDDKNDLYSFGRNDRGQLGINNSAYKQLFTPTLVMQDVKKVAASKTGFSLAIKTDGTLWTWGYNEHSQLGFDTGYNSDSKTNSVLEPKMVDFGGVKINEVVAGTYSVYALDEDGNVWSWGGNDAGQLGRNLEAGRKSVFGKPTKIDKAYFNGEKIINVAASQFAGFALTESKRVYSWGANDGCQLGLGSTDSALIESAPKEIEFLRDKEIVKISARSENCMALNASGEVYIWGSNILRQLGILGLEDEKGNAVNAPSPLKIEKFADSDGNDILEQVVIKDIVCGGVTNALLDSDGYVYMFGDAAAGGGGFDSQNNPPANTQYLKVSKIYVPMRVRFYKTMDIRALATSDAQLVKSILPVSAEIEDIRISKFAGSVGSRTYVEDTSGKVYSYGSNTLAQCNSGNTTTVTKPALVTFFRADAYDEIIATPDYLTGPIIVLSITLVLFILAIIWFEIKRRRMIKAEQASI